MTLPYLHFQKLHKAASLTSIFLISTILWGCSDKGLFGSKKEGSSSFEGKVTYNVDFQLPPERQQAAAMLPDEEFVYVKNGKTRLERNLAMAAKMTVLHAPSKDSMVMLIDAQGMGKGGAHRVPIKLDSAESKIEYVNKDSTRTIAGYECKKAILRNEARGKTLEVPVWFTEKIEGQPFRQFQGLKGFPLQFESSANGIKVKKVARVVEEKEVSDSLFDHHPEGYTTRSLEEFQQIMGGAR